MKVKDLKTIFDAINMIKRYRDLCHKSIEKNDRFKNLNEKTIKECNDIIFSLGMFEKDTFHDEIIESIDDDGDCEFDFNFDDEDDIKDSESRPAPKKMRKI